MRSPSSTLPQSASIAGVTDQTPATAVREPSSGPAWGVSSRRARATLQGVVGAFPEAFMRSVQRTSAPPATLLGGFRQVASWVTLAGHNIDPKRGEYRPWTRPWIPDLLRRMDAYWRAANYLSVGQIYLLDNPLLKEPLKLEHVKPRLLGHWGTTPGQNFIYVHLNRVIKQYDLNMIYISGPGHGGPALVANTYLEGTYSELYPNITPGRSGAEAAVQAVLVSRRHSQPRGPRDARLDPRRGRAGLQPEPRLRRGVRQPRPDRRLRRRRRRGRDRPAGHELALQQVPRTRSPTAPCCRSCT